jgi:hypothetical protein
MPYTFYHKYAGCMMRDKVNMLMKMLQVLPNVSEVSKTKKENFMKTF